MSSHQQSVVIGAYPHIPVPVGENGVQSAGGDVGAIRHQHLLYLLRFSGRQVYLPHAVATDNEGCVVICQ